MAVATDSGAKPSSCAPSGRAACTAAARARASDSAGIPLIAASIAASASSGSRKKSPASRNPEILSSTTSRSTTTSLPPGTLNSPCIVPAYSARCGHVRVEPGDHVGADLCLVELVEHLVPALGVDGDRHVAQPATLAVRLRQQFDAAGPAHRVVAADHDEHRDVAGHLAGTSEKAQPVGEP